MSSEVERKSFTTTEYHLMGEAGVLKPGERVELIYGDILKMPPIGAPHGGVVDRAARECMRRLGDRAIVRIQGAVEMSEYSEPQPDIVLLRPKDDFYEDRQPGPADIFLIIEIADSSLAFDRRVKAKLYAESGVPEYWLADIKAGCLWAYSQSDGLSYRLVRSFARRDMVVPTLLSDCPLPVAVFLRATAI